MRAKRGEQNMKRALRYDVAFRVGERKSRPKGENVGWLQGGAWVAVQIVCGGYWGAIPLLPL